MRGREHVFGWAFALSVAACWVCAGMPRAQAPSGSIVEYTYDVVGNIVAIQSSSTQLNVASFSPESGPVGATVTIVGSGFSTSATDNSVRINGTAAAVVGAARTQLTITVPPSATTGPISVTVAGSTVSSASSLVVAADYSPPTIASFSPSVAVAGTTVSIAGSNFNPTIANDSARVGARDGDDRIGDEREHGCHDARRDGIRSHSSDHAQRHRERRGVPVHPAGDVRGERSCRDGSGGA